MWDPERSANFETFPMSMTVYVLYIYIVHQGIRDSKDNPLQIPGPARFLLFPQNCRDPRPFCQDAHTILPTGEMSL